MHSPIAQITRSARNIEDAPKRLHRQRHVAWSRRAALLIAAALTVLAGQTGQGQGQPPPPPPNALKFFKNFFVTGDYLVAGVGLEGLGNSTTRLASGLINLGTLGSAGALPTADSGAEVLAAFLYWQVVTSDGSDAGAFTATFNGRPLGSPDLTAQNITTPDGPIAVIGDPAGTAPCWSSGGGTGQGGSKRTFTYRADVLRFLDIVNGRHRITGTYPVQIPDLGNSSATPRALGASLVVIYRRPNQAPVQSLNAIVMYDGSYTMDNAHPVMAQTVKGFYDPASVNGKITHIAGAGQLNKTDLLTAPGISETNAFRSSNGASWDTITRPTGPLSGSALASASFTTMVDSGGSSSADCLTWGVVIYRTEVNDTDNDGLLNKWETSTSATPLYDANGERLPALGDLGANPNQKDLFVEIGYMNTAGTSYGGVAKPAHTHRPTYAALEKVGDAFAAHQIAVHFDVGGDYQGQDYIIPVSAGAKGGESLDEAVTQCIPPTGTTWSLANPPWTSTQPWICHFQFHPGTVGWKTGFRFIRDEPIASTYEACGALETDGDPLTTCNRRFDANRRDMFHYVWFAHALAIPKASCLLTLDAQAADTPTPYDTANPNDPLLNSPIVPCMQSEPLFHVPVTNTGVGDLNGGDAMVALGGFNNSSGFPVGTDYMQAATLMHELGHNLSLLHGAASLSGSVVPEPACKPNYLSVMNYLFQLRGLFDANNMAQVDFAGPTTDPLNETALGGGLGGAVTYRTSWYAPAANVPFDSPATRHCDGSPLKVNYVDDDSNPNTPKVAVAAEPSMTRVDSPSVSATIANVDWNQSTATQGAQDVNLDGIVDGLSPLHYFNDWDSLRLNQLASRRNIGAWYWVSVGSLTTSGYAASQGPLSLNVDSGDIGPGDLGGGYLGGGYLGGGYLGGGYLGDGDVGRGDLGGGYLGGGYLGGGYLGGGYLGGGYLGTGLGGGYLGGGYLGGGYLGDGRSEMDTSDAVAPPNNLLATPVPGNQFILSWTQSILASEFEYRLYRYVTGSNPSTAVELPGSPVPAVSGQVTYSSLQSLLKGTYTYVVKAKFVNPTTGEASGSINVFRK